MKRSAPLLLSVVIVVAAAAVTGCSTFNRDWKRAAHAPAPPAASTFEGRWEGRWESDQNHHQGALRCLMTRQTNNVYSARFRATYKRLFNLRFGYSARLEVVPADSQWAFRGEANLGWYAGGLYRYEGQVSATNFYSTYTCKYDRGTFVLTRPPAGGDAR